MKVYFVHHIHKTNTFSMSHIKIYQLLKTPLSTKKESDYIEVSIHKSTMRGLFLISYVVN